MNRTSHIAEDTILRITAWQTKNIAFEENGDQSSTSDIGEKALVKTAAIFIGLRIRLHESGLVLEVSNLLMCTKKKFLSHFKEEPWRFSISIIISVR